MPKYRKIDVRIWNDAKFSSLSDRGKLAFLFLLTHPHLTSLGAMRATLEGLAAELEWTPEAFREAFQEALSKGLVEHDGKASFIGLPNFLKYNRPESPNVVKSWQSAVDLIPECKLKHLLCQRVKGFAEALGKGFAEALPEAFRKGMPYQEQEQEQEHYSLVPDADASTTIKEKSPKFRFSQEDFESASWMHSLNLKLQPGRKTPNLKSWANCIRLMRESDQRTDQQIRELYTWCHGDAFWCSNVLSPEKLREKWDDLTLKKMTPKAASRNATEESNKEAFDKVFGSEKPSEGLFLEVAR